MTAATVYRPAPRRKRIGARTILVKLPKCETCGSEMIFVGDAQFENGFIEAGIHCTKDMCINFAEVRIGKHPAMVAQDERIR